MYGVKFKQDTIQIQEGTKTELEYRTLRKEFNAMSLEELDSERARELERRIWGRHANYDGCDYVPGENIERRKKALQ